MATESVSKCLADLKVVDLRNELDARGLDKTGTKPVLQERLIEVSFRESVGQGLVD